MRNPIRRGLDALYRASGWAAAIAIVVICALVAIQVVLNLIDKTALAMTGDAIGLTIPSYADFTGFFLAAASFLALAHTLREGGHIRVTLLLQNINPRLRHFIEIWCVVLAGGTSVYFTWYMASLAHESWVYNDLSPGMVAIPIWIPQVAMLIGLAILSIALVDELATLLRGGKASYEGRGENLLTHDETPSGGARS